MRNIFFDTEFIDTGKELHLISIGMTDDDGNEFYAERRDVPWELADEWLMVNVIPKLGPIEARLSDEELRQRIIEYVGPKWVRFWAWYGAWDWILLNRAVWGKLIDNASSWPNFVCDLKQWQDRLLPKVMVPSMMNTQAHNALGDARWCRQMYFALKDADAERENTLVRNHIEAFASQLAYRLEAFGGESSNALKLIEGMLKERGIIG